MCKHYYCSFPFALSEGLVVPSLHQWWWKMLTDASVTWLRSVMSLCWLLSRRWHNNGAHLICRLWTCESKSYIVWLRCIYCSCFILMFIYSFIYSFVHLFSSWLMAWFYFPENLLKEVSPRGWSSKLTTCFRAAKWSSLLHNLQLFRHVVVVWSKNLTLQLSPLIL